MTADHDGPDFGLADVGGRPLRVGLDMTPTLSGLTGVARYSFVLESGLRERGVDVRSFAIGRGVGTPSPGTRRLRIPLRIVRAAWAGGLRLRAELLTGPVDLLHSVDLDPPPTRAPLVVTVHDLAAVEYPHLHPPRAVAAMARRLRMLDRAAAIVADSHATAEALVRHGIDRSRVAVVHCFPPQLPGASPAESGVDGPYLLAVGELCRRKDYPTMFAAFARATLPHHRLVVVGPSGFGAEEIRAAAEASGLHDRLVLVGFASDHRLSALYAGATALCLTSHEEGFGLPMVEAMQRGLPIVASDISVVHEIAGAAAVTAGVGDVEAFAAAMSAVVGDASLRARLSAAAVSRAADFSAQATVDGILAVYRGVVGT